VHPEAHLAGWTGLMQADAYAGFNRLYEPARKPGPIVEAACWAHARREFSHDRLSRRTRKIRRAIRDVADDVGNARPEVGAPS